MAPQLNVDETERVALVTPTAARAPTPPARLMEPHELTFAERQGLAMAWVGIALGMFLLLGGLALWAAVALHAGFVGWLIGLGVVGIVIVLVILAVNSFLLRPRQ